MICSTATPRETTTTVGGWRLLLTALAFVGVTLSTTADAQTMYVSSTAGVNAYDVSGSPLVGFTPITVDASFVQPQGLAIGPDGLLYVAGQDSNNILRYNATTGAFVDQFASFAPDTYPEGLAFGPDVNADGVADLFVADWGHNAVLAIPTAGAGAGVGAEYANTDMHQPIDVKWGPDGKLYVASRTDNAVQRYNADGSFEQTFATSPSTSGLAFSPDGSKLYTDNSFAAGSTIEEFDAAGMLLNANFATGLDSAPKGLAFGPDGNLYVAVQLGAGVAQIDGTTGAVINPAFVDLAGARARFVFWSDGDGESLPGDFDNDDDVDGADFLEWQRSLGDAASLSDWKFHFGESGSAASAVVSVPEPAAMTLLVLGVAFLHRRRCTKPNA